MNANAKPLSEQELNNIRNVIFLTGQMLRSVDLENFIANAQRYSTAGFLVVSAIDYQKNEPIISRWAKVAETALQFRTEFEKFEALVKEEHARHPR